MDIKVKIEEVVSKVKSDGKLAQEFKAEPVKTVEKLIGVDLPDDVLAKIVDGVKAKVSLDELGSAAGGVMDKVKGLFKK